MKEIYKAVKKIYRPYIICSTFRAALMMRDKLRIYTVIYGTINEERSNRIIVNTPAYKDNKYAIHIRAKISALYDSRGNMIDKEIYEITKLI